MTTLPPEDAAALERFRAFVRMRTDHPAPTSGYREALAMLRGVCADAGLSYRELELEAGHPLGIATWAGLDPALSSVVLNTHMDVVPAELGKWTKDPWAADVVDGRVYGRGTQDMKSVGMGYVEAIRRLAASGFAPARTLHLLFVPDEEVGGARGIKLLLAHALVRELNIGLVLDEGLPSPDDKFAVYYGERKIWWLRVRAVGPAGHGSRFIPRTAVAKLVDVVNRVLEFRAEQEAELARTCGGCGKTLGDVTTMNCTVLQAGDASRLQYNVIPTEAEAGFDCRIPATVDLPAFKARVDGWCAEEGVTWELVAGSADRCLENPASPTDGEAWERFARAVAATGVGLHAPAMYPAATDSRWIRLALGVPCFGFSPIRGTPVLLHDHDEFVPVEAFLEGIRCYEAMLPILTAK